MYRWNYRLPKNEATNQLYGRQLSLGLNDLREDNQLCDIIINVGGTAFNAHRAVLAASSAYYYKAMFTSGFKESTEKEINIDGNPDVFKVLIHYAYTGVLKMSPKMAFDVLDMACYMQFTHVYKTFKTIVDGYFKAFKAIDESHQIPPDDVFKIYMLAKNYDDFKELEKAAVQFMEDNVEEMKRSDVFMQNASASFLENFLCRDELATCHADEEKQVLELVINWLKQDWETRHTHAHSLLSKVRLGLVTPEHLTELVTKDILEKPECKALVDEVLQLRTSSQSDATLSLKSPQLFANRNIVTAPVSSFGSIGDALHRSCTKTFKYYHTIQQCWKYLDGFCPLPHSASNQSLVVVNGTLYAAGGLGQLYDSEYDMSDLLCKREFRRYDAKENCWIRLYSMNVVRNSFPMVHLDGYIYAIGGSNDYGNEISDVERFDLSTERWEILPPLPEICRSISAVAFKGKIIVHGIDLYASQEKYILQVYHPNSKCWQSVHSEDHEVDRHGTINPPHLYVYKDVCYRVSYVNSQCDEPVERYCTTKHKHKPVVHALEVHPLSDDATTDTVSVKVGESINQEHIPENMVGAFRIADEVFVSINGFSHNTGISISSDQITDVDVDQWEPFSNSKGHRGMICSFTFDRKEMEKEIDWGDIIPFE